MIIMLNEQAVVFEVLNAIRARAARQLQIPHDWVEIRLERDRHLFGKPTFHPIIEIKFPSPNDATMKPFVDDAIAIGIRAYKLTPEELEKELATLMSLARGEIGIRLAGLDA